MFNRDNSLISNNSEFASLDKSNGDDSVYLYVDTDGVNNGIVVDLKGTEARDLNLKNAYIYGKVELVEVQDNSKFENVYDLNNIVDFEKLQSGTEMNYNNINKDTTIVFENGMGNTYESATYMQDTIQKDFLNSEVGLINNVTGKYSFLSDYIEWKPNYLTTKDVLNAHQLQQLSPSAIIVTHSAGNEDIYKANRVNALLNAITPYKQISVGSPTSLTKLLESANAVGANVITQINHPNDPVANGFVNENANYEIRYNPLANLKKEIIPLPILDNVIENHPFDTYYNNEGVKEKIKEALDNE